MLAYDPFSYSSIWAGFTLCNFLPAVLGERLCEVEQRELPAPQLIQGGFEKSTACEGKREDGS